MESPDYIGGKVYWSIVKRKDGEHLRATIRYKVTAEDGTEGTARKTKMYDVADTMYLCPLHARDTKNAKRGDPNKKLQDNRRDEYAAKWKNQLVTEHKEAVKKEMELRERKEREEQERIAREREESERAALPSANMTVEDVCKKFIDMMEQGQHIQRSTVKSYRLCAKHVAEGFPNVMLCDLKSTAIEEWETKAVAGGHSGTTVLKWHRLLSEVCKWAVNHEIIDKNPCSKIRAPSKNPPQPNTFDLNGAARFLMTLDLLTPSPVVTASAMALCCGLRNGEICGTRWRAYDEEHHEIIVEESIGSAGGYYQKVPKSNKSRRVPVQPALARMLDKRKRYMLEELQESGINLSETEFGNLYIVGYIDGRYRNPTRMAREFKTLAESLDLRGWRGRRMTLHGLRDTLASCSIASGADVRSVSALLGHSDPGFTLQVYADALPEAKANAVRTYMAAMESQGDVKPYAELASTSD